MSLKQLLWLQFLQELERQEDPRHGSPSTTTAAMLSITTAETVTQGSSGTMSGSDMIQELGIPQQVVLNDCCRNVSV